MFKKIEGFNFNGRVPNNTNDKILDDFINEAYELQNKLNLKVIEVTTVRILSMLEKKFPNHVINMGIDDEREGFYASIEESENSEDNNPEDENHYGFSLGEEITYLIFFNQIQFNMLHERQSEVSFVNNENGRDKLMSWFIGSDWMSWKKEGKMMLLNEKLSTDLKENNSTMKKNKI